MKKWVVTLIFVALAAGGGFFGGMQYQKSKASGSGLPSDFRNLSNEQRQQMFANGGGNGAGRVVMQGGMILGEIMSLDEKSFTVKDQNGSSKIVLFSSTTPVRKTIEGTMTELAVGTKVTVSGSANSDGSISAQNVQIRTGDEVMPGQPSQ